MRVRSKRRGRIAVPVNSNASKPGPGAIIKGYQEAALRYLLSVGGKGAGSRQVWKHVNQAISPRTVSRASVIILLDSMVEDGLLTCTEATGKGGRRRIYRTKHDEAGFKEHVAGAVVRSLLRDFPEETRKALEDL